MAERRQGSTGKGSTPGPRRVPASAAVEEFGGVSPARRAAFAVLEEVEQSSAHADDLLHGEMLRGLSQVDRNLATALVMGVLRWQIALDARMRPMLQRPDLRLASPVSTALRLGALQLLHMDRIPAHAALSESVELVRAAGHPHAAGMVNAILRRLQREPAPGRKIYESTAELAERLGHPAWLVERWVRQYGRTAAVEVCTHDQTEPGDGSFFAEEVSGAAVGEPVEAQPALPAIDEGSRLVAELASASVVAPARIWDSCAAPGGKTLVLARRHPEAELLATDVQPRRLKAMAERLRLPAPRVRVLQADATKLPEAEGLFDLILCDVPCSGTGTLARHPEIRLRLRVEDLSRQAARQAAILAAAMERLRPGGRLLYSTCSLEPEENEAVVDQALSTAAGGREMGLGEAMERLAGMGRLTNPAAAIRMLQNGRLRTLPGVNFQGDGFFAALLERMGG